MRAHILPLLKEAKDKRPQDVILENALLEIKKACEGWPVTDLTSVLVKNREIVLDLLDPTLDFYGKFQEFLSAWDKLQNQTTTIVSGLGTLSSRMWGKSHGRPLTKP